MNLFRQRLTQIQAKLIDRDLFALMVPTADPHLSEYLPDYWQERAWISGFTGSAGTLVITQNQAFLWTDSRYWVQAESELDGTGIVLQKWGSGVADPVIWLSQNAPKHSRIAIKGAVLSVAEFERMDRIFAQNQLKLQIDQVDIIDTLWQDRPSLPVAPIYRHDPKLIDDADRTQFFETLYAVMAKESVNKYLISSLDDIAWITHLRGSDVEYNPVFLSYLFVDLADVDHRATLFVDLQKVDENIRSYLADQKIALVDYGQIENYLKTHLDPAKDRLWIDPKRTTIGVLTGLVGVERIERTNLSVFLKAQKTASELDHIREAMRQDGAALCEFFADFEHRLAQGERLSELDVDSLLIEARSRQAHYVSPSFATIAGFQENGAAPHYRATPTHFKYLDGDGLLLIDSGAQYQNGTTDITRMVGIGKITPEQKADVTYVLKAHIALAKAHFPEGISAPLLDCLARQPLWAEGLDYGHGTGHGVGYFLNVHEPPQSIAYLAPVNEDRAMKIGMVTSNEPALYRQGKWGIRIENLVANIAADHSEFGKFLRFETLTLCPIDTRLLDASLLTQEERTWLNDYHAKVRHELSDRLDHNPDARQWLIQRTQAI